MSTSDGENYGFKYVNGRPKNMRDGYQTVTAFGVLSNIDNGYPVLLTEMTILTALRTAATSAKAAKHLAPKGARTMAMIGNGAQCEFQAMVGIEEVRLFDIDPAATANAAENLAKSGLRVISCRSKEEAGAGAGIITTRTADKQYATILTDNMIGAGVHINAIGGDCPGKTELHQGILLRSDIFVEYSDIFVEYPEQTRIEDEIQQLDPDHAVTALWRVIAGAAPQRRSEAQITLFDGVGFAIEDFSALRYIRDQLERTGAFIDLGMLADPDHPPDLFGMVRPAR